MLVNQILIPQKVNSEHLLTASGAGQAIHNITKKDTSEKKIKLNYVKRESKNSRFCLSKKNPLRLLIFKGLRLYLLQNTARDFSEPLGIFLLK